MEEILDALYPVGSIYICAFDTGTTCPLAKWGGKWTKVSSGRVLQGADSKNAPDSNVEAGLPNIKGEFYGMDEWDGAAPIATGAFRYVSVRNQGNWLFEGHQRGGNGYADYTFDASRSNKIYGNSTTVQPPAYTVVIWKRTA